MSADPKTITTEKREEIKKRLLNRKKELIEELKTKHKEVYDWLVDHNIDLNHLGKYSKNIAAALILTTNQINGTPPTPVPPPTPTPEPAEQPIDLSLSPDEKKLHDKAKHVWELYGSIIQDTAPKYDVDPKLIFATIMTESGGNQYSYRFEPRINDASYGLGQVLYGTAIGLGFRGTPQDMYQPDISIDLIARYHQRTRERYGDLTPEQMTIVYNTGSLFKTPRAKHMERFLQWYALYPGKSELASAELGGVE